MIYRILIIYFSFACYSFAAPVLNFSDITSGPKTGLGDGLGSGAIVTVWGQNLGSSQGGSKIYCNGVEASHVYYWKNADGTLPSGPSDLYTYHKMQEISFSVASNAADGVGSIYVTVGGKNSNTLPFTVRAGNILHVKTTGSNSSPSCSWNAPCASFGNNLTGNAVLKMSAGDVAYLHDGVVESGGWGMLINGANGTISAPMGVAAYPGATVTVVGESYGVRLARPYWSVSKMLIKAGISTGDTSNGFQPYNHARIIANRITDREVDSGATGCPNGTQGAISGAYSYNMDQVGGVKIYGNYIHDWGCDTTDKLAHTTYMTNRSGEGGNAQNTEAWEFGWNLLKDNKARQGIHNYDQNQNPENGQPIGDLTGTLKIHDNVIINQRDVGIDVSNGPGAVGWSCPVEIYNNVIDNAGIGPVSDFTLQANAITLSGTTITSNIKVYNNTIVSPGFTPGADVNYIGAINVIGNPFGGTVDIKNNIIYDTKNGAYLIYESPAHITVSKNLWYSTANSNSPPSLDSSPIIGNPILTNYIPQSGSPAINAGVDLSATLAVDLLGNLRSMYDLGAIESITYSPAVAPTSFRVPGGVPYGIVQ